MSKQWTGFVLLLIVFLASSCDKGQVTQTPPAQTAGSFGEEMVQTIVPIGNGDAYAIGLMGNDIWLLRRDEAVRVKEVRFSAANKPEPAKPFAFQ